jgi:hypothetical protein
MARDASADRASMSEGASMTSQLCGRFGADEISEVLGDKRRIEPYYIQELRARLLGPHATGSSA